MIVLYDIVNSGNCAKVRLMLSLLGLSYETRPVDYLAGGLREPDFLALNPLAQVPVLRDGDLLLRDSQAICAYLARRYGDGAWLPVEAEPLARVMQWLFFAANELAHGCARARAIVTRGVAGDLAAHQALAHRALAILDTHLDGRDWLETGAPTIADVVCYPYTKAAPAGRVPIEDYTRLRAWHARVEALPGFVPFDA